MKLVSMRVLQAACLLLLSTCTGKFTPVNGGSDGGGGSGGSPQGGSGGGGRGGGGGSGGGGAGGGGGADAGGARDGGRVDAGARDGGRNDGGRVDTGQAPDGGGADAAAAARFGCPAGPLPAPAPGPSQAVCGDYAFTYNHNEGPTWLASQGAFYFTHFLQGQPQRGDIIKYTPGGGCELFQRDVGCNGLAASPDGALLAACHQSRSIVRFDPATGAARTLATEYQGQLLDTPNDLVAHGNGTIYFTNPPFELGNRPRGVGPGVFRLDPEGVLTRMSQDEPPNGIALSPDERQLYALGAGVWDLDPTGVPSNRRELFTRGDGMAVDCAGNLYARGNIFDRQGRTMGQYGSGTNLAFGGVDGQTLLIAGPGRSLRTVRMNLPGLP
jgi:gluconolactonase